MKKFIVLLLAISGLGFAQAISIFGQIDVVDERVTYGSDSAIQIRILGGQVHRDTSTTDTAQQWKRQDNTSDSCSNPIYLGRTAKPVWKFAIHEMVRARDPDSSAMVYRTEVRRKRGQYRNDETWGPWVRVGNGSGYIDVTVQDTVAMPNLRYAASTWGARYGMFFVGDGTQIRVCPDVLVTTANGATDTLLLRNTRLISR